MSGGGPSSNQANAQRRALEEFNQIRMPTVEELSLDLTRKDYLGDYNAAQEQSIAHDPTNMEGVSTDPRLAQAQMAALQQLTDVSQSGLLPGEEAALRQSRRGAAGEAQAKSAQLMDEFARRGMGGSGAELASRLQAGQSSAQRMSEENDRNMQMAQQRALSAIGQSANLAGNIRQQGFGEQSDIARAKDAINAFNTQNQQSVQQRNIAAQNQATQRNIGAKQDLSNVNTDTKNTQQQYNKNLISQQYQNQINAAKTKAGIYDSIGKAQDEKNAASGQMMGNIIGAGGTIVGGIYGGPAGAAAGGAVGKQVGTQVSDVRVKKNVKEMDTQAFLDQLDGVEFEYKDSADGEGKQRGILAQDLEKIMPEAVVTDPDGLKKIDYVKLAGPMMANLAGLNKRLKKLEGTED
jgi:hypothetical protein